MNNLYNFILNYFIFNFNTISVDSKKIFSDIRSNRKHIQQAKTNRLFHLTSQIHNKHQPMKTTRTPPQPSNNSDT